MTHIEISIEYGGMCYAMYSCMRYEINGFILEIHFNGETYWIERRLSHQGSKTGEEIACDIESKDEALTLAKEEYDNLR